jgi:hypothetical protein
MEMDRNSPNLPNRTNFLSKVKLIHYNIGKTAKTNRSKCHIQAQPLLHAAPNHIHAPMAAEIVEHWKYIGHIEIYG